MPINLRNLNWEIARILKIAKKSLGSFNDGKNSKKITKQAKHHFKMIFALSSFSKSASFWGWPAAASFGGILVFIGLWMERGIGKHWFSNFRDLKRQQWKELWGWRILMIGILVEIGIGFTLAAKDEWEMRQISSKEVKNNPLNQLVSDISVVATINMAGTNLRESPLWGSPPVAYAELCDNRTNIDGVKGMSMRSDLRFYSTLGEFSQLQALDFKRINYAGDVTLTNIVDHGYILRFEPNPRMTDIGFMTSYPPIVNDVVKNLHVLKISVKFIPNDSEVAGGSAYLLLNGSTRMRFNILPQKALSEWDGGWGPGFESGFTLIATNGTLAPTAPRDLEK